MPDIDNKTPIPRAEIVELRRLLHQKHEAERSRIARELHDGPLQELAGLSLELALLAQTISNAETAGYIQSLRTRNERIAQQLRTLNQMLRPPVLVHFGLVVAIRTLTDTFRSRSEQPVIHTDLPQEIQALPEQIAIALYRICEHALQNVFQHAQAQHVHLRLSCQNDTLQLEIEDDGKGFAMPVQWLENARSGRFGLVTMLESAEAAGAQLEIQSEIDRGTHIRVLLPLSTL